MSKFHKDTDWLDFHSNPSKPSFTPPSGAVDAHCHVFGPGDRFPYADARKYTPCDASKQQLFELRDYLGFERNVIVQASCHGTDNSAMVDALIHSQGKARGVAVVSADVSDTELLEMHAAGVRGVRFNFVKRLVNPVPPEVLKTVAERVAKLGWHIVVYFEAPDLAEYYNFFASLSTIIVVDHMGRLDCRKPIDGAVDDPRERRRVIRIQAEAPAQARDAKWTVVLPAAGVKRLADGGLRPPRDRLQGEFHEAAAIDAAHELVVGRDQRLVVVEGRAAPVDGGARRVRS